MDAVGRDEGVARSRGAVERVFEGEFQREELVVAHCGGAELWGGERDGDDALAAAKDAFGPCD